MSEKLFAFGDDEYDGCACPAASVGYEPSMSDNSSQIATAYDGYAQDIAGTDAVGVLPERHAQKAWLLAVEEFSRSETDWKQEVAEVGEEIAVELGWL